ncbi:MAG: hypothetical protein H7296_14120 [Bacteroidia bacterium]|nr:hypothetical protein [Bacteroidia bacterium]
MWRKRPGIYPIRYGNNVQLLQSGAPFFDKLTQLIKEAQTEIHFQVYIFEPDTTGQLIAGLLMDAAKRGVKIYMILDAYGSKNFTEVWKYKFKESGISLFFYSPITFGKNLHMGMRLHHKIMVFDSQVALTGGINISDHYSHYNKQIPWLDFAVLTTGKVIQDFVQICYGTLHTVNSRSKHKSKINASNSNNDHLPVHARVLQNNWLQAKFAISWQYRQHIRKAQNRIILFASYFIPSIALKRLLKNAANRGVKVSIILGSVSDVGIVRRASEYFYADMLKEGIELYEWRPSVLHAKIALIDNKWLSVGSYNLNHLSDFGSIECNIEVYDNEFCISAQKSLEELIVKDCDNISWILYLKRFGFFHRFYNAICYGLVRISLNLLFFMQNRNNKKERVKI